MTEEVGNETDGNPTDTRFFAHVDSDGNLQGWYADDAYEMDDIPTPKIEVTKDQWSTALQNGYNRIASDGSGSFVDLRTDDEKARNARSDRRAILVDVVDPVVTNPLRWDALTETQQTEITTYRQALLDITDQAGFPSNISWPTQPSVLG